MRVSAIALLAALLCSCAPAVGTPVLIEGFVRCADGDELTRAIAVCDETIAVDVGPSGSGGCSAPVAYNLECTGADGGYCAMHPDRCTAPPYCVASLPSLPDNCPRWITECRALGADVCFVEPDGTLHL